MAESWPAWVIYDRPRDFPEDFVVREWRFSTDGAYPLMHAYWLATTLEAARAQVPRGAQCIPRNEHDEPQIVETWM